MAKQRTLVIIKPDAVASRNAGAIISRLEKFFEIEVIFRYGFTQFQAVRFYAEHEGKSFFRELVEFTCLGTCIVMVLSGENAIARVRDMVGATDPYNAAKDTIRRDFGWQGPANAVHASANEMAVVEEMKLFEYQISTAIV